MRGSRKFFHMFFFVDKGIEDPNTTQSSPSSARQQNAIYMAQLECWLVSFVIFQGIDLDK